MVPTLEKSNEMKTAAFLCLFAFGIAFSGLFAACATSTPREGQTMDLSILQKWSGDYPVAQLDRLPSNQQTSQVGYLGDAETFAKVWHAFQPGRNVPVVDFGKHLVVFSRNVDFYNRTSIFKVTLKDGVAEVLAMETLSAIPIEDKAAMAMAVIPRAGIRFIQARDQRIPVTAAK
jgi:hypothetical protein